MRHPTSRKEELELLKQYRERTADYPDDNFVMPPDGYYFIRKRTILKAVDERIAKLEEEP